MERSPKISVIVPVYNTERYLEASVRSVMNQTYRNLEIICVNDGSTDGSLGILRQLQNEDSRIIIVDKTNGGLGDARNAGLEYVTSEWVAFVDSDDTLNLDAYHVASAAFDANPDMVHFGTEIVYEDGFAPIRGDEKYYAVKYEGITEITDTHMLNSDFSAWNKLFRKSIIDKYSVHFEKIFYEDFQFVCQYMSVSKTVYYLKNRLYKYLRRRGSIMSETFNKTPRSIDHVYAYNYVYEFMSKNKVLENHRECMAELFVNYYWLAIDHGTPEIIPTVEEYATRLYNSSPMLQEEFSRTLMFWRKNQAQVRKRKRMSSKILEKIFSIKNEDKNGVSSKVARLFGVAIYRRYR